jgi:hypothetical protein
VFIGLSAEEQRDFLGKLLARTFGTITPHEEEWTTDNIWKSLSRFMKYTLATRIKRSGAVTTQSDFERQCSVRRTNLRNFQ